MENLAEVPVLLRRLKVAILKWPIPLTDSSMGETFWQKDSLVNHILFELWLIMIFRPVANFAQQS